MRDSEVKSLSACLNDESAIAERTLPVTAASLLNRNGPVRLSPERGKLRCTRRRFTLPWRQWPGLI
jgi:hypothetical protein